MLDVCLLGTAGVMPIPTRHLTSCFLRCNGKGILIDCGEGTQVALQKSPYSFMDIDYILLTHNHPDHFNGLPGLLSSIAFNGRKKEITIIAPEAMQQTIAVMLQITPRLPYKLYFHGLKKDIEDIDLSPFTIHAFKVEHNTICYGYSIEIKRQPKFEVDKAKQLNIPVQYWNDLQHGQTIKINGKKYKPESVMGKERKGLKIVYCTDSRPCGNIEICAREADLLILEGMYGDLEMQQDAIEKKHMMMWEAATIASKAKVKELWFTHYSPYVQDPYDYVDTFNSIYPGKIVEDGTIRTFTFQN